MTTFGSRISTLFVICNLFVSTANLCNLSFVVIAAKRESSHLTEDNLCANILSKLFYTKMKMICVMCTMKIY